MIFDYLIVGAGFAGSVLAERLASQLNKKVLLVDRRNHIGGNAYDHYNDDGILIHKYGPHILHINSPDIFEYLSQFTEWRPYQHRVVASVDGQLVPFPVYQPAAVVNSPNDYDYTRVTEFKYLTGQEHPKTNVVYEYPRAVGDPYYPVPRPENAERYKQYKSLADTTPNVHFVGRLATYKYYNMDQVVAQALTLFKRIAATDAAQGEEASQEHSFAH